MKTIEIVILSIGTNLGDRLKNLVSCVASLQKKIDGIIQISAVYETPAWGFSSDPFYNAAIYLKTELSVYDILKIIQEVENELGRNRNPNSEGYQARLIDIDIILYGNKIIQEKHLQIPHPRFHLRQFVLQPMAEFNLQWKHPLLNQMLPDLIAQCPDDSPIVKVATIG